MIYLLFYFMGKAVCFANGECCLGKMQIENPDINWKTKKQLLFSF